MFRDARRGVMWLFGQFPYRLLPIMTATVAASKGRAVVCRTAWVALPITLTPAAIQSSVQKKTCARSVRTSSVVGGWLQADDGDVGCIG